MTQEQALEICKYYRGEKMSPFEDSDETMWWNGEKVFVDACKDSKFYGRIEKMYDEALAGGYLISDNIKSPDTPKPKRVLMFYLDLWHGRWFPYDDLDKIHRY